MEIDAKLKEQFKDLACALSPECVFMDGQASAAEARATTARLKKQWKGLEKKAGRTITESEVFSWQ